MSKIVSLCVPKTIAFGGVATGIIKANEQEMVIGIIRKYGLILIAFERDARIGSVISVVAVLEVSSVKKVMVPQMVVSRM